MKKYLILAGIAILIAIGVLIVLQETQGQLFGGTTLTVPRGGTGATSFTLGECLVGAGTGAVTTQACGASSGLLAHTLGNHSDVSTSTLAYGHLLMWDGSLWQDQATSSLGITGSMIYPDAGIALSTGVAWGASITNNSANWNTAYGWGNHASAGYESQAYASSSLISNVLAEGNFLVGNAAGNAVATSSIFLNTNGDLGLGVNPPTYALDMQRDFVGDYGINVLNSSASESRSMLDVKSDVSYLGFYSYSSTYTTEPAFANRSSLLTYNGGTGLDIRTDQADSDIRFHTVFDANGANERMRITSTGNIGIGTTSPYAMFSVAGQVVGQYFTATSTATSTFPRLTVSTLLGIGTASYISDSATSTLSKGINITSGCFAINGTCVAGSSGTGITSLGPTGQEQTGAAQTFATSSPDTNITLTITSTGDVHTFNADWTGTLAAARIGLLNGFTNETDLLGGDIFPFYQDTSGANRDITWTNLMADITNTGTLQDLTVTGLTTLGNASTTQLSATVLYGALTGNAATATALAANGANCNAGNAPLGIDASGAVESCFDVWTEAENTSAAYVNASGVMTGTFDGNNFAGGAIGVGELIYGGGAGSFSELAAGTSGYILMSAGTGAPLWVATSSISVSGDVAGTLSTLTIQADAVHDSMIDWGSGANQIDLADIPGGISGANVWDFGGATSLEIVNNAALSIDAVGECGIDTTSGQFRCYIGTSDKVMSPGFNTITFNVSSSTWGTGTTTVYMAPSMAAMTVDGVYCQTSAGTLGVSLWDGTNRANYIATASTTSNYNSYTTNNTFTAGEGIKVDVGTAASSPTAIGCRFKILYTPD